MTKKKSTRTIALLTALVLVTACFIGGTIARYVTSTSSEDEARVAVWGINADGLTEMDLFNATYTTEDGTIVAQSNDGDKIIAPGTHKDNKFSIVNTDANLNPEVMYEIRISLDDSEIDQRILDNPSIQWRLDEGTYGTWEETKTKILSLSGHESGVKTYAPGDAEHEFKNGKTHTIGWQWLMDNGTDELDTEIGNATVNGDIKATIKVSVTAKQVDVDTTGLLDGNGQTFDLNNPAPLTFRSSAPVEELQSVKVGDDTLTRNEDYTAKSGSTIITLNENYLSELEKGNYTVSIISTSMTVKAGFKIKDTSIKHNEVIPTGAIYYHSFKENSDFVQYGEQEIGLSNTATNTDFSQYFDNIYIANDNFPEPKTGDIYIFEDFLYMYNTDTNPTFCAYAEDTLDGWMVLAIDRTKSSYTEILTTINGKDIKRLDATFAYNTNLKQSPSLPNTAKYLYQTYYMSGLEIPPSLPTNATEIVDTFSDCTSLTTAPTIHKNITNIMGAFYGCTALTGEIKIDATNLLNSTGIFVRTTKPIFLKGNNPQLQTIADEYDNVYVYGEELTMKYEHNNKTFTAGMTWEDWFNANGWGDAYILNNMIVIDSELNAGMYLTLCNKNSYWSSVSSKDYIEPLTIDEYMFTT